MLDSFRSIVEEFSDDFSKNWQQYANIRRSTIDKDPKNTGWALCPVHAYIKRANDAQSDTPINLRTFFLPYSHT